MTVNYIYIDDLSKEKHVWDCILEDSYDENNWFRCDMAMAFGLKDAAFTVPPKKQVQRLAGRPWLGNPACTKGWSQPEMDIDGGDMLILSNFI